MVCRTCGDVVERPDIPHVIRHAPSAGGSGTEFEKDILKAMLARRTTTKFADCASSASREVRISVVSRPEGASRIGWQGSRYRNQCVGSRPFLCEARGGRVALVQFALKCNLLDTLKVQ